MMTTEALAVFHLHFEGESARQHTVPAPALVQAIQALQRSIYLLALAHQGAELKQRARVNYELEAPRRARPLAERFSRFSFPPESSPSIARDTACLNEPHVEFARDDGGRHQATSCDRHHGGKTPGRGEPQASARASR
jgi:hypothetical protein